MLRVLFVLHFDLNLFFEVKNWIASRLNRFLWLEAKSGFFWFFCDVVEVVPMDWVNFLFRSDFVLATFYRALTITCMVYFLS